MPQYIIIIIYNKLITQKAEDNRDFPKCDSGHLEIGKKILDYRLLW